ncbi:GNAT family N-acetyltransferase [Pseudomonas abietaniphila]|uniref:GNAT family N-acetyltransferase n=1 Tax=Pseudomonas abietaniphila TaxID=89065 RepID=UPI000780683A|nr:GNAT family N-acetyltransferase [Pseudomonas abietaniphila]
MALPHFETERLFVRPRTMGDFEACLAMDRDPEVTQFIPGPWHDHPRHEAFLRDRIETSYGNIFGYWSLFPKANPRTFAGWVFLIQQEGVGSEIEIGWRLNRSAWGNGFATEAVCPIIKHAFRSEEVNRIIADIDPRNLSSLRVAAKIGMKRIGQGEHGDDRYALIKTAFISETCQVD